MSHINGAFVEALHRGNPTGKRGIVTSVQYTEPRYVVVGSNDYANGDDSSPMYDTESSFRRIPIVFATVPDRLQNAWKATDQDGCTRYIATTSPSDKLYRDDVLAILRATYVGDWIFNIEEL